MGTLHLSGAGANELESLDRMVCRAVDFQLSTYTIGLGARSVSAGAAVVGILSVLVGNLLHC